ncbi:PREDICTED: uncharacterized protein LOC105559401, partial [Vollenhovia emeryi]|uniref:uncharacterized protein LOC105559401 n=1 Tax=Vollenhovia emeryi TaxID=411798 RepID=UPI0005F58989
MEGYNKNKISGKEEDSYYQCLYCNVKVPKENFDFLKHSCFANINIETENIFVNENNCLFKGRLDDQEPTLGENNNVDEFEVSKKKKPRNKANKSWSDVDEVLINAVMKKP